jgi:hypothetical protein
MFRIEVKGSTRDSKQKELGCGPKDQGPKESEVKPNMRRRQKEGFEAEERGFED